MLSPQLIEHLLVAPGTERVRLKDYDTGWAQTPELEEFGKAKVKERAQEMLEDSREQLRGAQELLYASGARSVLVVLQAMDAAGKDGTIKHVMSGVNPQGVQVHSFKAPSTEERHHDFLWRCSKVLPERGMIGIFNRSYYEDVLVVRVHPELLDQGSDGKSFWEDRYQDIRAFERHLARNGTLILKFFLHVSKKEQKQRFLERLENPAKHWKLLGVGPRRAAVLGPIRRGVRGCARCDQHEMGAVVRGAGRSEVGDAGDRRGAHLVRHSRARPEVPRAVREAAIRTRDRA